MHERGNELVEDAAVEAASEEDAVRLHLIGVDDARQRRRGRDELADLDARRLRVVRRERERPRDFLAGEEDRALQTFVVHAVSERESEHEQVESRVRMEVGSGTRGIEDAVVRDEEALRAEPGHFTGRHHRDAA